MKDWALKHNTSFRIAKMNPLAKRDYAEYAALNYSKYVIPKRREEKDEFRDWVNTAKYQPLEIAEPTESPKVSPKIKINERSPVSIGKEYITLLQNANPLFYKKLKEIYQFIKTNPTLEASVRKPLKQAYTLYAKTISDK